MIARSPVEILTVGTDPSLWDVMRSALGDEVALRSADGLQSALSVAAARPPDLLFVDVGPPPAEAGFSLASALRAAPAMAGLPLILFGPFDGAESLARGIDVGAADLVGPPFAPAWLRTRLRAHLEAVRARAALQQEQAARLRAEHASRDAQRARNDLLGSMGHDIRTPMTAILGMSHLALQSGLNPKQRNYLEKVERSAELLLTTLTDIVDSSRLAAGALELQHAPFELADMLDLVARMVGLRTEEQGLELLFDLAGDLPSTLVGDMDRLAQTLVYLGLDTGALAKDSELVIRIVQDRRDATRARLNFQLLRNGPRASRRMAVGTETRGNQLGDQLLRLMGSQREPQAAGDPNPGVAFAIEFDLPEGACAAPAAPLPGAAKVLVVDDNASARRILLAMCDSLGLRAEAAGDGWDALRLASHAQRRGQPVDLVLLDAKMPGMDGIECARHLLASRPGPPAVLLLTSAGRHDANERLTQQRVAVNGVLAKPVTPRSLRAAVTDVLRRPASQGIGGARSPPLPDQTARLRGARILLVEDNPIIQELALELLSSAGMVVSLAENGREALDRLGKQRFDGVLMDCHMPVLDGYEATRALRAQPHLKDLPVIALTANALDGDRDRVIAAGMNDHVAKPFDLPVLFETLARWVQPAWPPGPAPAPPPRQGADDPLARLPGIDAQIGRTSTMHNDKLYRRLLGMFRDGQRDVVADFSAAREAGELATAMRLAHNLRAVSGSLGATKVQQSAGALERACADRSSDATLDLLLAQVEADLKPVIAGLTVLPPPS